MKNKGAIKVFMVLITTAMLTLAGLLIDMSRILLAYYTVESVSESATRSLMANYDPTLVGDYGLYAIENSDANKKEFLEYVKKNINAEKNYTSAEKTFSFLKFDSTSLVENETSVSFSNPISDQKVFQKQVEDYHTPRALMISADEIVDKFMGILTDSVVGGILGKGDAAKDSVNTVKNSASNVNQKALKVKLAMKDPKRIAKLDLGKSWKNLKTTAVNSLAKKSAGEVFNVANDALFSKKTFSGASGFDDAVRDLENELKLLEESLGTSQAQLSNIKTSAEEEQYNQYNGNDTAQYVTNGTAYSEVQSRIDAIRANIKSAQESIETAKQNFDRHATDAVAMEVISAAYNAYKDELIDRSELQSIINTNRSKISNSGVLTGLDEFTSLLDDEEKRQDADSKLKDTHGICYTSMNSEISSVTSIDVGSIMEVKEPEIKQDTAETEQQEDNLSEAVSAIDLLKQTIEKYTKDITKYEIYGRKSNNPFINNLLQALIQMDPTKNVKEIIKTAKNIKNQGFGYQFVLTSYIMDKTNYLTSTTQRDHYFKYGETEYILHHFSFEPINVVMSVKSVFELRLAINFIYYLCFDSPPAGEGITLLVKIAYSAIRSAIRSAVDMVNLFVLGQPINIIPSNAKWADLGQASYRDHLTVAMLFETEKQPRLINTINATIADKAAKEGKTTTLADLYTTVETKVTVDCDLVFMNMFGFRDILGKVVDGKYRITKVSEFSY